MKGNKIMWIKLTYNGDPIWCNANLVRRFEFDRLKNRTKLVYTTKDAYIVDQTLDEVMVAMGYNIPPAPPLETHAILEDEEVEQASAVELSPQYKASKPGSKREAIEQGALSFLKSIGNRATSGVIADALIRARTIPQDQRQNVSSYLSKSKLFNHTAEGYGLLNWPERPERVDKQPLSRP
jgi:hypothetical protein